MKTLIIISEISESINDFWTLLISFLALLATVIIGFSQFRLSKKQEKIDKKLDRFENQKGEVLLISILYRYFVTFVSNLDISNPKVSKVKIDSISVNQYIIEIDSIISDLNKLVNNPFFIKIIEKYPELNKTIVQLRRDSTEVKIKTQNNSKDLGINQITFLAFYDLFYILKNNTKNSNLFKTKTFKDLEAGLEQLVNNNPNLLKKN
jgi:uncharacterized protein YdcH (DUF465 family)